MDISTKACYYLLWMHILARSDDLKLKCLNGGFANYKHTVFLLHKMLIDGLEWCGLLVDYCDVFISCLDSHSDGTHSLQMIHWWASDAMLDFSKSVLMKKQTHLLYILDGLRVRTFSESKKFWVKKKKRYILE